MTKHRKPLKSHDDVLEDIAKGIDITPSLFETAKRRYESLGSWLDREESILADRNPEIYPQGSFALGTVIKPPTDKDEYDIDLVCMVQGSKQTLTQRSLKELVGEEVKKYAHANNMNNRPEDGRRCWTLQYSESARFHMDVLPSIPDSDSFTNRLVGAGFSIEHSVAQSALAITDKELPNYTILSDDWNQSNPKGYARWFHAQMLEELNRKKEDFISNEGIRASVDDIPNHRVKTTLQRSIQLLKRHRDNMFENDPEFNADEKPISIIITTLAARSYSNESSLSDALRNILTNMDQHIELRSGESWVVNPVNETENFADKWKDEDRKRQAFEKWLSEARKDFSLYLYGNSFGEMPESIRNRLGPKVVDATLSTLGGITSVASLSDKVRADRTRNAVRLAKETGTPTKPWLL